MMHTIRKFNHVYIDVYKVAMSSGRGEVECKVCCNIIN